jgi:hypothetical protein
LGNVKYENAKRRKRWRKFVVTGMPAYPTRYDNKKPGPSWRDAIRWALDGRCDAFIERDDSAPIELLLRPKNRPDDVIERHLMTRVVGGALWLKRKNMPRGKRFNKREV